MISDFRRIIKTGEINMSTNIPQQQTIPPIPGWKVTESVTECPICGTPGIAISESINQEPVWYTCRSRELTIKKTTYIRFACQACRYKWEVGTSNLEKPKREVKMTTVETHRVPTNFTVYTDHTPVGDIIITKENSHGKTQIVKAFEVDGRQIKFYDPKVWWGDTVVLHYDRIVEEEVDNFKDIVPPMPTTIRY